jgi:hypothetical protein
MDGRSLVPRFEGNQLVREYTPSFDGSANTGLRRIALTTGSVRYDWSTPDMVGPLWRLPDHCTDRTDVSKSSPKELSALRRTVDDVVLPDVATARESFLPRAFITGFANGFMFQQLKKKGEIYVRTRGGSSEDEPLPSGKWLVDETADAADQGLLFIADPNSADAPKCTVSLHVPEEVFWHPDCRVWLELRTPGQEDASLSVSVCGSDEIELEVPGGDWAFADAGVFPMDPNFAVTLRAAPGASIAVRRLMFHPDIPGAQEAAFERFAIEGSLEMSIERQEELRALGYVE